MSPRYVVTCHCGQQMRVEEKHFGLTGKCTKCGKPINITRDSVTPIDAMPSAASVARATRAADDGVPGEWNPGDVILDLYDVKDVLGQGGMGRVYRVHHKGWNTDLAVKCPLADSFRTQAQRDNFVRECETWVNLGLHPHTVSCYYVRTIGDIPRVFAEYVEGGTLEEWITSGKLYEGGKEKALERILDIAIQFAWGLQYAHEQGLIHQDVKPANVMMTPDGVAKVTDFGLANARTAAGAEPTTGQGNRSIMASYGGMTPAYCSPEQADNAARHQAGIPREQLTKLTRATDIYSWAVSLFEMFNGGVSWLAGNVVGEALKQYDVNEQRNWTVPQIPNTVFSLLAKCLQTDLAVRPKDFTEAIEALSGEYQNLSNTSFHRDVPKARELLAGSLNNQALSLFELGNFEKALEKFDEAFRQDPLHIEAMFNYVLIRLRNGSMDEETAITRMQSVCSANSGSQSAFYSMAMIEAELGNRTKAVEALEAALRMKGPSRYVLGLIEEALKTIGNLPTVSFLCRDQIRGCALNADGSKAFISTWDWKPGAAIGGPQPKVSLWNTKTRTQLWIAEGGWPTHLNAEGSEGISGGPGGLKFWDAIAGQERAASKDSTITFANAFKKGSDNEGVWARSMNDRWMVNGRHDNTIRIRDMLSGKDVQTLYGHFARADRGFSAVSISDDGQTVLSIGKNHFVRIWDTKSNTCIFSYQDEDLGRNDMEWGLYSPGAAISADGEHAIWGGANGLRFYSVDGGRKARCDFKINYAISTNISADTGDTSEILALQKNACDALRDGNLEAAYQTIVRLRLLPNFERKPDVLALWSAVRARSKHTGIRAIWKTGLVKHIPSDRREPLVLAANAGGTHFISIANGTARLWNAKTLNCECEIQSGELRSVFRWDGSIISLHDSLRWLLTSDQHKIHLWDLHSQNLSAVFEGPTGLNAKKIFLSQDAKWLYCIGGAITIWYFDVQSGRCVRQLKLKDALDGSDVRSATISPNEKTLIVGCEKFSIFIDAVSGRPVGVLKDIANAKCVSHGLAKKIVCFGSSQHKNNYLRVHNAKSGQLLKNLDIYVDSISLSRGGRWAIVNANRSFLNYPDPIQVFDLYSGECITTLPRRQVSVVAAEFCLGDEAIVTATADGEISIWHVDWDIEPVPMVDFDEGARQLLLNFLTLHTPYAGALPNNIDPTDEQVILALTRGGKPTWTDEDFKQLLNTLANTGYGWLRPEGVKKELQKMAATWEGPPPLS